MSAGVRLFYRILPLPLPARPARPLAGKVSGPTHRRDAQAPVRDARIVHSDPGPTRPRGRQGSRRTRTPLRPCWQLPRKAYGGAERPRGAHNSRPIGGAQQRHPRAKRPQQHWPGLCAASPVRLARHLPAHAHAPACTLRPSVRLAAFLLASFERFKRDGSYVSAALLGLPYMRRAARAIAGCVGAQIALRSDACLPSGTRIRKEPR